MRLFHEVPEEPLITGAFSVAPFLGLLRLVLQHLLLHLLNDVLLPRVVLVLATALQGEKKHNIIIYLYLLQSKRSAFGSGITALIHQLFIFVKHVIAAHRGKVTNNRMGFCFSAVYYYAAKFSRADYDYKDR